MMQILNLRTFILVCLVIYLSVKLFFNRRSFGQFYDGLLRNGTITQVFILNWILGQFPLKILYFLIRNYMFFRIILRVVCKLLKVTLFKHFPNFISIKSCL